MMKKTHVPTQQECGIEISEDGTVILKDTNDCLSPFSAVCAILRDWLYQFADIYDQDGEFAYLPINKHWQTDYAKLPFAWTLEREKLHSKYCDKEYVAARKRWQKLIRHIADKFEAALHLNGFEDPAREVGEALNLLGKWLPFMCVNKE